MHRFSRMHLSPEVARRTLDTIDLEEKSKLAEGISLIAVIDHRRDYLSAGYSCMRDYCVGRLHMSEDKAFRRIQVARVALVLPEVFELLADGRLGVTTASILVPHLTPENAAELLAAAAFRTKHELVKMLADRSRPVAEAPAAVAGEALVESSSGPLAPAQVSSLSDVSAQPVGGGPAGSHDATSHVDNSRRGRVTSTASGNYEVRITLTDEEHEILRQATALLGHAIPSGDPALVIARAMKHYLAHLEKQRLGKKPGSAAVGNGRGIPKPLRRLVWERDGGRCAFVSADGHRCEATTRLELDHITPVAQGGATTAENLRLLCGPHNQYEAERVLGKEHVQEKRELAQRERGRAKAAARARVARAKVRDAARQALYDDLLTALRGLGYDVARARRGATLVNEMPEASLETCMRAALTQLARPLLLRSERLARCSA